MTLHGLIHVLTEDLKLTPEQQFQVTAKIKRLIHAEKASLCYRLMHYAEGAPIYDRTDPEHPVRIGQEPPLDGFIYDTLKGKYETHEEWSKRPDKEVVTWSIGSHKFVQHLPPCKDCGEVLMGTTKSFMRVHGGQNDGTYCKLCAEKRNIWNVE